MSEGQATREDTNHNCGSFGSELNRFLAQWTGHRNTAAGTSLLVLGIFAVLNPVDNLILLWCVLFLFMCLEGIYLVHAFRGYFRSLEATHRQLQQFQLQNAFCWCCSVNHVHPVNGQPIPVCDREIVRQCITSWFGAEQNFDQSVPRVSFSSRSVVVDLKQPP